MVATYLFHASFWLRSKSKHNYQNFESILSIFQCFVDNFDSELKKLPTFRRGARSRGGSIVAMPKMRDCPNFKFQNKFVKRNLFPPFLLRPLTFRVWEAELGGNDQCSTEEGSANLSGPTRIRFRLFSFSRIYFIPIVCPFGVFHWPFNQDI